jgi:hypothetical protein
VCSRALRRAWAAASWQASNISHILTMPAAVLLLFFTPAVPKEYIPGVLKGLEESTQASTAIYQQLTIPAVVSYCCSAQGVHPWCAEGSRGEHGQRPAGRP